MWTTYVQARKGWGEVEKVVISGGLLCSRISGPVRCSSSSRG